jgi:hypothetical protein
VSIWRISAPPRLPGAPASTFTGFWYEHSTQRRKLDTTMSSRKSMEIWATDLAAPKSLHQRRLQRTTISVSQVALVMQKHIRTGQFRKNFMKPRITINEMSRKQLDLTLWRRFGCGGWFLVQTAGQASDRRNHRLVRLLRGREPRRSRMALESQTRFTSGINL